MLPTISVQIVTFNSEEDIVACLNGVYRQTYPIQEVVIIDNHSQDQTLQIIRPIKDLHIIKNKVNNGFTGGHNQGIHYTTSDYVLVLNPDVRLHKDYIKNIVNYMENDSCIGLATGKLYRDIEKKILDSTGITIKKNRRAYDRGSGEIDVQQYDFSQDIFGVSGAAAIYRREMLEDVSIDNQFFDESFFAYKEDVDVSWRAQLLGWKSVFVPSAIAEHQRGWQDGKKRSDISLFIRRKSYINRYYYLLKNDHLVYFILHLPIILAYEISSFIYAIVKEPKLLGAWKSFKLEFKLLLKKRKVIMNKKKVPNKQIYSYFKGIW